MVTILPAKTSFGADIGAALGKGFQHGFVNAQDQALKHKYSKDELELASKLRTQEQQAKNTQEAQADKENYKIVNDAFGKEFADVWKAGDVGWRTELIKTALKAREERIDIASYFKSAFPNGVPQDIAGGQQAGQQTAPISQQAPQNRNSSQAPQRNPDLAQLLTPELPSAQPLPTVKKIGDEDLIGLNKKERSYENLEKRKKFEEFQNKLSTPILEESINLSKTIPQRQANIDIGKSALKEGNVGGFDQDYLAEIFHFEPLRTAKGAQLKSAIKDLFVKSIQSVGQRPNQWIEMQIGSATPAIGKSLAANETLFDVAQFMLDLDKKKIEVTNTLRDRYLDELGYVPVRIADEVSERVGNYAVEREQQLAYDLRKHYEAEQGVDKLKDIKKVTPGTPLTREMAYILWERNGKDKFKAEQEARKIGFTIPGEKVYAR